jgi:hypothetical protein
MACRALQAAVVSVEERQPDQPLRPGDAGLDPFFAFEFDDLGHHARLDKEHRVNRTARGLNDLGEGEVDCLEMGFQMRPIRG